MVRCKELAIAGSRAFFIVIVTLASAVGQANAEPRAVVELFTSQGCSSCPPADALLGKLAHDPNVVALTLPIDYWDYIGWKDTLALPGHAHRQKAYSKLRGDRGVYTPQVIVNGTAQALGSDQSDIERAIGQSRRSSAVLSVPISIKVADGRLTVDAAASKEPHERAEVWLCPVASATPVNIGRGENHGRTIIYHNTVRRWIRLGEWNGTAASWSMSLKDIKGDGADRVAVLLQAGGAARPGGPMLGAAMASLP